MNNEAAGAIHALRGELARLKKDGPEEYHGLTIALMNLAVDASLGDHIKASPWEEAKGVEEDKGPGEKSSVHPPR